MVTVNKTVLFLDLGKKTYEVKVYADAHEYIGGVALALRLLGEARETNPVVLSVGPLNAAFPFVSKTCCLFYDENGSLVETYGGGRLGLVLGLTSFDAVVLRGKSPQRIFVNVTSNKIEFLGSSSHDWRKLGALGRRSYVQFREGESTIDDYFNFDHRLGGRVASSNLESLIVSSDRAVKIEKTAEYQRLYQEIFSRGRELKVPYDKFWSCGGCPAGCHLSFAPEFDSKLRLSYCLVACGFAREIFEDVATVFACFDCLGLNYSHETLEEAPQRISQMREAYARLK